MYVYNKVSCMYVYTALVYAYIHSYTRACLKSDVVMSKFRQANTHTHTHTDTFWSGKIFSYCCEGKIT